MSGTGDDQGALAADIAEQPAVLARALEANGPAIERARRLVSRANLVRLVAIGSSRHAAGYGARALDVLAGIPAVIQPAPGEAVETAAWRMGDVAIVVSQSGRTPALLAAARVARGGGSALIAVTNAPGSRLEREADVALSCGAGPERVVAATKSVTAQALLLRAIAQDLDACDASTLITAVQRATTIDVAPALRGAAPGTVVCSGFAAEWVADEIALKFAEVTGRHVTAEPLVEHLHGPVAASTATLAFLDPSDPNASELVPGSQLVRIGPDASYDLVTPSVGAPSLDALVQLVIGQRLVLGWARRSGQDPDCARGLSKITSTR